MPHSPYLNHSSTFNPSHRDTDDRFNQTRGPSYVKYQHRFMDEASNTQITEKEKNISYLIGPLNIISAGLCVLAFGVGIAWFGWPDRVSLLLGTSPQEKMVAEQVPAHHTIKADAGYYSAQLSGQNFLISGENLRHIHRDEAGNARRIDLISNLEPKTAEQKSSNTLSVTDIEKNKIFISLSHIAATTTPETRLETTYKHHLADEGVATTLGLTLYRFKDDSGYGDQELYTGTLPDGPYISVCFDELAGLNASRCLASSPAGTNLVARYSFDRTHIKQWARINQSVKNLVSGLKVSE